jgi:phospholipid/cholesterol/gamma-HCH transport system substrate-binding protein
MRHNLLEALIGLVVLIFTGYFLIFAYKSGDLESSNGYNLFAKFDRIDGLIVGSNVNISGVKIGKVSSIEIEPRSYQAKVFINISHKITIPSDTSAEIVSESLLGGKYITLIPGISTKPLKPNSRIIKTQSSVNLESLLTKFVFNSDKTSVNNPTPNTTSAANSPSTPNNISNDNNINAVNKNLPLMVVN